MIYDKVCQIHSQDLSGLCIDCPSGQPLAVCQRCITDEASSHQLHTFIGIDNAKLIFNAVKGKNPDAVNQYFNLYHQFEEFFDQLKKKLDDNLKNLKLEYQDKFKSIFDLVMVLDKFQQDQMYQIFLDPSLSFALREVVRQKKFTELHQQQLTDFANSKALIEKELNDAFARAREIIATGQPPKNVNAQPCQNCPALKQEITGLNQQVQMLKQQIEKVNAANQQLQNEFQQATRKIDELGAQLKQVNNEKQACLKEKQELQVNIQNLNQKVNQLNEETKKKPVLNNPVKHGNNKQAIMDKSLDTLDKSDGGYGKVVAKWSQVYDKLIEKGKTGFCGKETNYRSRFSFPNPFPERRRGYCGTSHGVKAEDSQKCGFYCCEECWKLGEGDANK